MSEHGPNPEIERIAQQEEEQKRQREEQQKAEQAPKKKQKIVETIAFVDASEDNEQRARDMAEAELLEEKEAIGGKPFFKRIWGNFAFTKKYEYNRQKKIAEIKKQMEETGSWYGTKETADETRAELQAVVERFVQEEEDYRHYGEERQTFDEYSTEKYGDKYKDALPHVKRTMQDLIKRYADGSIPDREAFLNERNRAFDADLNLPDDLKRQLVGRADNMFEAAETARAAFEHHKSLDDLDLDFEIVIGKARSGVRTKAELNSVDRAVDWARRTKIGSAIDETTLAAGIAVAYSVGAALTPAIARSRVAAWATFGATALVSGGFAGLRENKRVKEERAQHARERARGKEIRDGSKRREEMEAFIYDTISARESARAMEAVISEDGNYTPEQLQLLISTTTELDSRVRFSDKYGVDLVRYSDEKSVEQERTRLDLARIKAKAELKRLAGEGKIDLPDGFKNWPAYYDSMVQSRAKSFGREGQKLDKEFNKFKAKKVAWAATKAVGTGLVIGGVAQEVRSLVHPGETGLAEGVFGKQVEYATTPLEWVRRYIMGTLPEGATPPPVASTAEVVNYIEQHRDNLTPEQYINEHPDLFSKVHRELWYDNDTPKPVFDKNELKLWWGGDKNTGLTKEGNYIFDVQHMKPKGSYHGDWSVDAQKAIKEGKLRLLLSLNERTQAQVVEIPVGADGQIIIDKNSETAKLFFETDAKGHAVFKGKYAEVAEMMGDKNNDGIKDVRLLATHVGKGVEGISVVDRIPQVIPGQPGSGVGAGPGGENPFVYPPPVIPFRSRREMETMGEKPLPPFEDWEDDPNYFHSYFGTSNKRLTMYKERRSSTFDNPDKQLDVDHEVRNYFERQDKTWNDQVESLSEQIEAMDPECKLSVFIPVAGHQEGENIYKTLEGYQKQNDFEGKQLDPRSFEIVLFVNHPKDVAPDKTLDEIKRFQDDYPDLKVRMIYSPLDRDQAVIGTIRKLAADVILKRQIERGEGHGEHILVSNDADNSGISETYIANFLDQFEKHENIDAILGKIDWEPAAYVQSPLLYAGTRMFQYLDAINRHPKDHRYRAVGSSGANFAVKSSAYAAVGGYIEGDDIAEDKHLGEMIKGARRGSKTYPISYGHNRSLIYTNARRGVSAINKGLAPVEQWSTQFGPDDELRQMAWELPDGNNVREQLENPDNVAKMQDILERFVNRTLKLYELPPDHPAAERMLGLMGIDYVVDGEKVKLTGIDRLVEQMKRYQDQGMRIYERKLGVKDELRELYDNRDLKLEEANRVLEAHASVASGLSGKAKAVELDRNQRLYDAITNWEANPDLSDEQKNDLKYLLIQSSELLVGEGINVEALLNNKSSQTAESEPELIRVTDEEEEPKLIRVTDEDEVPQVSRTPFTDAVGERPDGESAPLSFAEQLGSVAQEQDNGTGAKKGQKIPNRRLDDLYEAEQEKQRKGPHPELFEMKRSARRDRAAARNEARDDDAEIEEERIELPPEPGRDKIDSISKILEQFPTVKIATNEYIKIPPSKKQEVLRNFLFASKGASKGLPDNVEILLGTKYHFEKGKLTLDITKPWEKIRDQLHSGLKRANPDNWIGNTPVRREPIKVKPINK